MAQQSGATTPTLWEKTKTYSSTAYTKTLKPGFDKAYNVVDKLGAPVNRLSNKVGSEAFWPTTLDKESEKCARILRTFCKDGFYDKVIEDEAAARAAKVEKERTGDRGLAENVPQGVQRNVVKIPAKVIQNAVGLAIFTTMRTGWLLGGSGGAGVVVARHPETREWSPPSGIMTQNFTFGFLAGADIYDTILVINNYKALEAFTRLRCTLGTEVGVVAGPVGVGGEFDMEVHKKPAPVWSYVKSRGLYAGIALAGNIVIERTDENERFYRERIGVSDILACKARYPPEADYRVLTETIKAAQGDAVDESELPTGDSPADMDVEFEKSTFGIPAEDDDDPYGVKALEAEGLHIREAGTHQRPSAEVFEFKPSPSSPIYPSFRRSIDVGGKRKTSSWRGSTHSLTSANAGMQTAEGEIRSPAAQNSRPASLRYHSPQMQSPQRLNSDDADEDRTSISKKARDLETPDEELENDVPPRYSAIQLKNQDQAITTTTTSEKDGKFDDDTDDEKDEDRLSRRDSFSDIDSDAEIETAVPVVAQARVVNMPKRPPPALPPRNPGRMGAQAIQAETQAPTTTTAQTKTPTFTIKFKTAQPIPARGVALRTSVDNWTVDRPGQLKDGVWQFHLDTATFGDSFECKFVILPNRWMHDPNLVINKPVGNDEVEFTDSRVIFPPASGQDKAAEHSATDGMEEVSLTDASDRRSGAYLQPTASVEDEFMSVPATPEERIPGSFN